MNKEEIKKIMVELWADYCAEWDKADDSRYYERSRPQDKTFERFFQWMKDGDIE